MAVSTPGRESSKKKRTSLTTFPTPSCPPTRYDSQQRLEDYRTDGTYSVPPLLGREGMATTAADQLDLLFVRYILPHIGSKDAHRGRQVDEGTYTVLHDTQIRMADARVSPTRYPSACIVVTLSRRRPKTHMRISSSPGPCNRIRSQHRRPWAPN